MHRIAAEISTSAFRDSILSVIRQSGQIQREQLLEVVFEALEIALVELRYSGLVELTPAADRSSHLDVFTAQPKRRSGLGLDN